LGDTPYAFINDKSEELEKKAEMLVLVYDYRIAKFKRQIPHEIAEDGNAVVKNDFERILRNYRRRWSNKIAVKARKENIPQELIEQKIYDPQRIQRSEEDTIEMFENLREKGRIFL